MILLRIAPLLFALWIVPCWISESTEVVLEGNAFKNVLVAFSPFVTDINEQKSVLSSTKTILKEASSTLHTATGLSFSNVIFLIPRSWGSGWAEESPVSPSMGDLGDADFQVDSAKENVFGTEPFTIQHGGCGESGLRITIPTEFLLKQDTDADQSETYKKAQLIVREWVRYRYGVFDEGGFPGDERYPLYSSLPGSEGSDIRVTECTHQQAKYIFRDGGGNECIPVMDRDSGLPKRNSECSIHPEEEGKENITSSLMYRLQVPNMKHFCDDQDRQHNSLALNKQNVLCKARSVGNVMNSHPDFKEKQLESTNEVSPDPEVQYVQNQAAKIVIAVDQNAEFQTEAGFLIKNAVIKFILELPEETKCGFIKYNDTSSKITLNLTSLTSDRSAQIAKVNPAFIRKDKTSCSHCALLEALVMLEQDLPQSRSSIILVATSNVTANDELRSKIQKLQVCLVIVIFTGFEATADGFNELLELSPCARVWEIRSDGKLEDILLQMYDIFTSVIHRYEEEIRITTLTTASLTAGSKVAFDTDSTVESLTVWVTSVETKSAPLSTKLPIDNIVLQRNGEIWKDEAEEIFNMPSFVFFVRQNALNSYWTCNFYGDSDISLVVSVTASAKTEKFISSRIWIKDNTDKSATPNQQQPVILYTQVSAGIHPVINAKVIATVNPPGGGDAVTFPLFDNGVGDPDVTKHDGIYSRYFTQFTAEGEYIVTVTVSDDGGKAKVARAQVSRPCCGSVVKRDLEDPTGSLRRVEKTTFTAVSGRPQEGYKPSTIFDFRVLGSTERTFSLRWTSPGSEMDHGIVKTYDLRMFITREDAQSNFDSPEKQVDEFQLVEKITPMNYPALQEAKIELNATISGNRSYFLAVRAANEFGKSGDVSNIVEIFVPPVSVETTVHPDSTTSDDGNGEGGNGDDGKAKTAGADGKTIGLIVGIIILVLVVIISAYVAFYFLYLKPKRKKEERDDEERRRNSNEAAASRINNNISINDGTVADKDWKLDKDPISPVNSWPADVLLGHHDLVKDAKKQQVRPPIFRIENLEGNEQRPQQSEAFRDNVIYGGSSDDIPNGNDVEEEDGYYNARDIGASDRNSYDLPVTQQQNHVPHVSPRRTTHV